MAFTALAYHLGRGGDPFTVALFSALANAKFLLDFAAGLVLDRVDRRKVLIVGVLARAFILLVVAFLPKDPSVLLLFAALFLAVLAFDLPAWQILLVERYRRVLERESGKLQAAQVAGDGLGDLIGGTLLRLRPEAPFLLGSLLLALEAVLLRSLPPSVPRKTGPTSRFRLSAGLRLLARHEFLKAMHVFWVISRFLNGLALGLLPLLLYAKASDPFFFGLHLAALGLGSFLGGVTSGRALSPARAVWYGHLGKIAGLMLLLAPYPASLLGLLLFALSNTLQALQLRAIRQRLSPPEVIGNVQGSSMALLSLGALLGNLISGLIGGKAVEWPLIYAIAGQIALFAFALGPLSPKRITIYHKISQ